MLPDTAHLVTLRGKSTEPGFGISSLPLPNITQRGSKSHLHLPSSHAGFHAHWRHWATARLKLILKHGFLLQLHWKKTLNLQGRTSPRTFLFCFSCCCYIFFFFFFFLPFFFFWSLKVSNNASYYFWYLCEECEVFHKDSLLAKCFMAIRAQQHAVLCICTHPHSFIIDNYMYIHTQ